MTRYLKPNGEILEVLQSFNDLWIVGTRKVNGSIKRFKSAKCPPCFDRRKCQTNLDRYARALGWAETWSAAETFRDHRARPQDAAAVVAWIRKGVAMVADRQNRPSGRPRTWVGFSFRNRHTGHVVRVTSVSLCWVYVDDSLHPWHYRMFAQHFEPCRLGSSPSPESLQAFINGRKP